MTSDRIIIAGIQCAVNIGVEDWERQNKQPCAISLELLCDLLTAGRSDNLADAIDYAALINRVADFAETHSFHLLERLAEDVSALVLENFPVRQVEVLVRKLSPPINRPVDSIAIQIRRPVREAS
ncbi:MAG: dihydroneopterin aldolase [Acidobacteria bacterium]|nr:dihydroneopterin aldolase [Acidobacteriota bacterium]MBI3655033.1 dihydroneopterin aldolase [Acidobacteriota bacterium]